MASASLFAEIWLTYAVCSLLSGSAVLSSAKDACEVCHILNWLVYLTDPQRWWKPAISLTSVVENAARAERPGCDRQLPSEGPGRMTGCVGSVQCQESWEPLLTKYPELFVPEHSESCGIGPSWEDSVAPFIKPIQHLCLIWGVLKCTFSSYTTI